jgi:hypothetical protein
VPGTPGGTGLLSGVNSGEKISKARLNNNYIGLAISLAEREGFEPPIPLRVCRISSAVHSTTLPPLRLLVVTVAGAAH